MNSSTTPKVSQDVWGIISQVLEPEDPNPDKDHKTLICDEEKRILRDILKHRLGAVHYEST